MAPISETDTSAIANLQKNWSNLHDLDRGRAVRSIQQSGASIRKLAKALQRSPSLLRRLLQILDAPLEDQLLARQGKISTNELVRQSKVAAAERAAKARQVLDSQCKKAAENGCKEICAWLKEKELTTTCGEVIIDEARRILAMAEQEKKLPSYSAPPNTALATIIERTRPSAPIDDNTDLVAWYADWLARWSFFAMPDRIVRHTALSLALNIQIKREDIWGATSARCCSGPVQLMKWH